MGSILMAYASQSGNTEVITDIIAQQFTNLGHDVTIKSFDFEIVDVTTLKEFDAVLAGTYTWDDGDLPYEVEDFYIDLEDADITNLIFGVYGSADSCYDTYGAAIDLVAEHMNNLGAHVIEERLKIDRVPGKKDEVRCVEFANIVSAKIAAEKNAFV